MGQDDYLLELKGIVKKFPGTVALRNVDLRVRPGEVHALVGENGAGKSTLMKIVMGLLQSDEGTIAFDGKSQVRFSGPSEAIRAGISMIHQELNPILHMTIAENVFLHREPTKLSFFTNSKKQNEMTKVILEKNDLGFDPAQKMLTLTLAQMQVIEITKAVAFNAKLVIMDEPTSSLDVDETKSLFERIRELKRRGISVIYISHRLEEINQICDRVSVLRDGQYIGTKDIADIDRSELIRMMVGRSLTEVFEKTVVPIGGEVLRVEGYTRKGVFEDISFSVHAGEILGFSGLIGAGRSEVMKSIFGIDPVDSGKLQFEGRELKVRRTSDAIKAGIAMVTEDRREYGLVLCRSLLENISLPSLKAKQRRGFINHRGEFAYVHEMAKELSIKASNLRMPVSNLSGGNQQKVILAKWLIADPRLIILDEPTRGIDIGAKSDIYKLICKFASQGLAIILVSSELPEVMGMSDRIIVMHEGRMNGEFSREEISSGRVNQEDVLNRAFGGK